MLFACTFIVGKHRMILFSWLLVFLNLSSVCPNEYGDKRSTFKSHDGLFREIDLDDNGKVSKEEMDVFVIGTGGENFDEQFEIDNAVDSIMEAFDENNDTSLKLNEFSAYWNNIAALLSSEEVLSWIEHSLQLPLSIVEIFAKNGITSHDFTELLENDGALIESDLGIYTPGVKRKLMRGMKMVLFGMSKPPPAPSSIKTSAKSASSIIIEWSSDEDTGVTTHRSPSQIKALEIPYINPHSTKKYSKNEPTLDKTWDLHLTNSMVMVPAGSPSSKRLTTRVNKDAFSIPVHKYILQRRVMNVHTISPPSDTPNWDWLNPLKASHSNGDRGFATDSSQFSRGKWVTIYDGLDLTFTDMNLVTDFGYKYRLVSWNTFGHSKYVEFESHTKSKSLAKSPNVMSPDIFDSYLQETTFGRSQLLIRCIVSAITAVLSGLLTAIKLFGLVVTFVGACIRYKWMGEDHPISPFFWKLWEFMNVVFNYISHYGGLLCNQDLPMALNLYSDINGLRLADDEGVITPGAIGIRSVLPRVESNLSITSSKNSSDNSETDGKHPPTSKNGRSIKFMDDKSAKPSTSRASASRQYCSDCSKSFSVIKGRGKHHCGHCGVLFCSKHAGHVSHSFYLPCPPILGSCLCVSCNNELKEELSLRQVATN